MAKTRVLSEIGSYREVRFKGRNIKIDKGITHCHSFVILVKPIAVCRYGELILIICRTMLNNIVISSQIFD